LAITPGFVGSVIDATGEKFSFSGHVWFSERTGTKDIERIGFRFGAVTKSGGSGLTVSLQDLSTSGVGPDGTPDQTVAIANADASFVANTWIRTGTLSANRTVSYGDGLGVVIEYDGSGRLSSDTVAISGLTATFSLPHNIGAMSLLNTSGTWAGVGMMPNLVLEFSDGSFGTLIGAFPCSAVGSFSYGSGSTPDEQALIATFPGPVSVDGVVGIIGATSGGDFDIVLYEGKTAMTTRSIDKDHVAATTRWANAVFSAEQDLDANTNYYVSIKPTSATAVALYYFDVADANHLRCHGGGAGWCSANRVDAGAWSPVTTRRPFLSLMVSGIGDDAGGGGAPYHGAMSGGML
jgi:hypothetical protein